MKKTIHTNELGEIEKISDTVQEDEDKIARSNTPSDHGCIELQALKDLIGDDPEEVREFMQSCIGPLRELITEMQTAYEQHSFAAIRDGAHKLYSSARSIGANELADLCQDLEQAGEDSDWTVIEHSDTKLESMIIDIEDYVSCL